MCCYGRVQCCLMHKAIHGAYHHVRGRHVSDGTALPVAAAGILATEREQQLSSRRVCLCVIDRIGRDVGQLLATLWIQHSMHMSTCAWAAVRLST
jgi:hypothetical protein